MPSWKDLGALAGELAEGARRAAEAADRALGRTGPYRAVGYRGYGNAERVLVLGRVLQQTRIDPADARDSVWRNLLATLRRVDASPLPFAEVRARFGRAESALRADDEGFVRGWMASRHASAAGWHDVELTLDRAPGPIAPHHPARVLVPPATSEFGVVSDMDDTVLQSEITSFLRAARLMLLENARTRLPFPGVAAFYRALEQGGRGSSGNPIFYVSSSPWNVHDVIAEFLDAQRIPVGPMLLRDWDIAASFLKNREHKLTQIREILDTYPSLPFILVGDSGQEDPEIYRALVAEYPGRILAVYIRNVTPQPERIASVQALANEITAAGSSLLLADDTLAAAKHAAAHGWIAADSLGEIGEEKRDDEGTTGAKVDAPGAAEGGEAPTAVVDESLRRKDL